MVEFSPKTAIVTGSDSGIGRATAVALAEASMDVGITWHRDQAGAERTAGEVRSLGRRAVTARLDLTELPGCGAVIDSLARDLGGLDVFVNNSGTGAGRKFLDTSYETWREVVATDLDGAFVCLQHAARLMVEQGSGGRIIAVTSTVAPGEIATPMTGQTDLDPRTVSRPGIPLGRPGDAREVAAVIAFLASPASAYVTGASWAVDGGMLQMGPQAGSHITGDEWRSV
jgi:NAD(P)-dependent dehydrogenase (short-subunit alcohol dehydrogenase family)